MVLDEQGKKYSKRLHGANILDWREDGYLPQTMINYLVLLGWTPAEEGRELFTPDELAEAFTIERLGRSAGKFDLKKLQWLNGQHIRMMPVTQLRDALAPIMANAGLALSSKPDVWQLRMTEICQEKIPTLNDIVGYTDFFFHDITEYEEKSVQKQWRKDDIITRMDAMIDAMQAVRTWTASEIHDQFVALSEAMQQGLGHFTNPARLALTGKGVGPGLFELAELLGRDECLRRMQNAVEHIKAMEAQV
jgi:glutamyl/glutaminyl-tRNA synthetase